MLEKRDLLLITNNDHFTRCSDAFEVAYKTQTYLQVLERSRDAIHNHYRLLTHPMAGSLKPNQTPYKSVLLMPSDTLDYHSLELIENAIMSAMKFMKCQSLPKWNEKCLKDFKTLDCSFIEGALLNKSLNPCLSIKN